MNTLTAAETQRIDDKTQTSQWYFNPVLLPMYDFFVYRFIYKTVPHIGAPSDVSILPLLPSIVVYSFLHRSSVLHDPGSIYLQEADAFSVTLYYILFLLSMMIVTGPSLIDRTCISSPNLPVAIFPSKEFFRC